MSVCLESGPSQSPSPLPRSSHSSRAAVSRLRAPSGPQQTPTPTQSATSAPVQTSIPTPKPVPTPTPTAPPAPVPAAPIGFDCYTFLPAPQVSETFGHLIVSGPAAPAAGSAAESAVAAGGIACRVLRESLGTEMVVAVSAPGNAAIAAQTAAMSSMDVVDAGPPAVRGDGTTAFLVSGAYVLSATQAGFDPNDVVKVLRIGASTLP